MTYLSQISSEFSEITDLEQSDLDRFGEASQYCLPFQPLQEISLFSPMDESTTIDNNNLDLFGEGAQDYLSLPPLQESNWSTQIGESNIGESNSDLDFLCEDSQDYLSLPVLQESSKFKLMAKGTKQTTGLHEQLEAFSYKNISDWTNDDCFDWALSLCRQGYLHHTHFRIDVFKLITGQELLSYTQTDFRELIDEFHGSFFYQKLREFKTKDRELQTDKCNYNSMHNTNVNYGSTSSNVKKNSYDDTNYLSSPSCFNSYLQDSDLSNDNPLFDTLDALNSSCDSVADDWSNQYNVLSTHEGSQSLSASYYPSTSSHGDDSFNFLAIDNMNIESLSPVPGEITTQSSSLSTEDLNASSNQMPVTFKNTNHEAEGIDKTSGVIDASVEHSSEWFRKIPTGGCRKNRIRSPKSWEFVLRLLQDPRTNPSLVRWEDESQGVFRLMQKEVMSRMWGRRTNQAGDSLSYESFARLLRHHYKSGILIKVTEKQMVYKFGPKVMELISQGKKW